MDPTFYAINTNFQKLEFILLFLIARVPTKNLGGQKDSKKATHIAPLFIPMGAQF